MQDDYFDEVYNNTYSNVLKYIIVRCKNHYDIQDIVQNVYTNFYIRLKKYGRFHFFNVNKYLYRISRDELSKYYRNSAIIVKNISIDDENITLVDDHFLLEDYICDQCQENEVWEIIKSKDIITFKIFTLYFLYDYKLSQIAQELNITDSNVKNKFYRTLNELKKSFAKEI